MTGTAGLSLPVVKEIRALATAWVACLVTMIAAAVLAAGFFRSLGVGAYFFGAAALGAVSIGHEYSHRTLTMLLAQPARRERLLLAKLGVLLVMLLLLCAVAAVLLFNSTGSFRGPRSLVQGGYLAWALWLPVFGGLTVAPWLTMLSRNPIAGTVFTVTIPGLLMVSGQVLGMAIYGRVAPEVFGFQMAFFRVAAVVACALGAVMSWRTFMRLEAIDGRDPDLRLPEWLRRLPGRRASALAPAQAVARRRERPLWLLVKKELHLQGMTYVIAGIYVLGWLAMASMTHTDTPSLDTSFNGLTVLYAFLTALLVGALASAEERHLGTLEWQVMLPIVTATQWIAKIGVVIGLTFALGVGLPLLVSVLNLSLGLMDRTTADIVTAEAVAPLVVLAAGGLYISSLCSSGVQALLVAAAATPAVVLFVQLVLLRAGREVFAWSSRLTGNFPGLGMRADDLRFPSVLAVLLIGVVLVAVLRFAMVNHRSSERGARRVVKQLAWIAGGTLIAVTVWAGLAGAIR